MNSFEVIETSKNIPCALFNGYQYRIKRKNNNETISWLFSRTELCCGKLITQDNSVLKTTEHKCKPDVAANEIQKKICVIKKRAREEDKELPLIFREEINDVINQGYDFVTQIPIYSTMKHSLNTIRSKTQGCTKDPIDFNNINLTEEILNLNTNGENFLLFDDNANDRIIAFSTNKGKEALANYEDFFMDGTFKSCSKQFYQIYSIHVDVGSTLEETNIIPVVYVLLPNKKKETYERLFFLLKEHVNDWKPKSINMDFEMAAINALQNILPNVDIRGCNFHFNQCLWRKVQDLGLVNDYTYNEEVCLHIRMCSALPYLPLQDIDDGWLAIQEESPENEILQKFYDYFVEQWLENPKVSHNMWNCHGRRHRTNNSVEGWNFRLNNLVKKHHPNFYSLIRSLKNEAKYNDYLYDRNNLNLEGKRRKTMYVNLDRRIEKILQEYAETKDIKKCLKVLSYVQKFQ